MPQIPSIDPIATIRARIMSWAGLILLEGVPGGLACPRCEELAENPAGYSPTLHVHSNAEKGAAMLAAYMSPSVPPAIDAASYGFSGMRPAPKTPEQWGRHFRHAGSGDPLGPVSAQVLGWDASPVGEWERVERARSEAYGAQQDAESASERKRLRAEATEAARSRDDVEPAARQHWQTVADAWTSWESDRGAALAFRTIEPQQIEVGEIRWH